MQPDHPAATLRRTSIGIHFSREAMGARRRARVRLAGQPPSPDFRDQCGLKRLFHCPSWSLIGRVLRWATRNSDH